MTMLTYLYGRALISRIIQRMVNSNSQGARVHAQTVHLSHLPKCRQFPSNDLMAVMSFEPRRPLCDLQDSLLEITLRSRVIEKLSMALDICLFNTQHERDRCPQADEDLLRVEVGFSPYCTH